MTAWVLLCPVIITRRRKDAQHGFLIVQFPGQPVIWAEQGCTNVFSISSLSSFEMERFPPVRLEPQRPSNRTGVNLYRSKSPGPEWQNTWTGTAGKKAGRTSLTPLPSPDRRYRGYIHIQCKWKQCRRRFVPVYPSGVRQVPVPEGMHIL